MGWDTENYFLTNVLEAGRNLQNLNQFGYLSLNGVGELFAPTILNMSFARAQSTAPSSQLGDLLQPNWCISPLGTLGAVGALRAGGLTLLVRHH